MTTDAEQLAAYNQLVTQKLMNLKFRHRFCVGGFNEVVRDLDLPMPTTTTPDHDNMVQVQVRGFVRVEADAVAALVGTRSSLYLTDITVEPTTEPVMLADINQKLKVIVERKAQVRAYALKRVMDDEIGQLSVADVNSFLAALGISPLVLKKYLFDVPVASKIRYEVLAELEVDARIGLAAQIKQDIDEDYLERGDLGHTLPSPTGRRVLVSTEDAE